MRWSTGLTMPSRMLLRWRLSDPTMAYQTVALLGLPTALLVASQQMCLKRFFSSIRFRAPVQLIKLSTVELQPLAAVRNSSTMLPIPIGVAK